MAGIFLGWIVLSSLSETTMFMPDDEDKQKKKRCDHANVGGHQVG